MIISRKALCLAYGLIAVLALVGTWGNNVGYLNLGFLGANLKFWGDTLANPASRSITVDIFFLGLPSLSGWSWRLDAWACEAFGCTLLLESSSR